MGVKKRTDGRTNGPTDKAFLGVGFLMWKIIFYCSHSWQLDETQKLKIIWKIAGYAKVHLSLNRKLGQPDLISVFLGQAESMNSDWSNLRNITWEGFEVPWGKIQCVWTPRPRPHFQHLKIGLSVGQKVRHQLWLESNQRWTFLNFKFYTASAVARTEGRIWRRKNFFFLDLL